MHKIKEKIQAHKAAKHEQNVTGTGYHDSGMVGDQGMHHHHHERVEGEVVAEHPVAVGVAEIPVVITEQERAVHGHHHEHHHERIGEEVCGQKTFTEVEDHPVVRERVERIVEHRPVEKQYVVETRFVGEQEMGVAGAEIVDIKDRVVDVAAPGPTCPVNTGAVMNEVIGGVTGTTHTGGVGATGYDSTGRTGITDRL